MKPIFTNLSNLAFTVGVDNPVSRETWRNDLRPSLNNDFKIDTSKLSSYMGDCEPPNMEIMFTPSLSL